MQDRSLQYPDYIFEASWEVCNKVGGIYTVLSTKANSLQKKNKDHLFFIGPDIWTDEPNPWFIEDNTLFQDWLSYSKNSQNLDIRIGRWNIPGEPIVFLVKFDKFLSKKNDIYTKMWLDFGVDSIDSYGDYDESCMFAYATAIVIESFYRFYHLEPFNVIAHFNEWMLGVGALYIKKYVPKIATMFTTHATSIGRSIAGNNLPLYKNIHSYNGDQMARQLNMVAKHSIEKKTAQNVDCFTTVSDITAQESTQLLQRQPDVVTPNGFEKDFIPKSNANKKARIKARSILINVAEKLVGHSIEKDALLIATSGRYEYKNKGIDVFIDAVNMLRKDYKVDKNVVAFVMVPGWINGPRKDLQEILHNNVDVNNTSLTNPFVTHELHDRRNDMVMNQIQYLGFTNSSNEKVKIIFIPSYLNGSDGIFNVPYYDLLIGLDVSVFPSYYEPWGYTPHESVAFSVPTITTTLAGFGLWAKKKQTEEKIENESVKVITRDDSNYSEVAKEIALTLLDFSMKSVEQIQLIRIQAKELADKADWAHFIEYYYKAYDKALHNSFIRLSHPYTL